MPKKYNIKLIQARDDVPAEILVYGPIGKSFWSDEGITGKEFTDALNQVPRGTKVTIGVNSQGGEVGEGLAMFNAIQRRSEDVTARIDGYALSIASFFPLAAAKVVSPKSSIWMIHNAWAWSQGNAKQHRKDADMLDTHDETLVAAYVERTGKSAAEVRAAMEEETWFTGDEAAAWGLADEVNEVETQASRDALDMSRIVRAGFTSARLVISNAIEPVGPTRIAFRISAQQGGAIQKQNKDRMNKTKLVALLKKHGVESSESWTDEQFEAALADLAAKKPDGDLAKAVAALNEKYEAERKRRIKAAVLSHVEAGRIPKEQVDNWVTRAMADETVLDDLAALPDNRPEYGGLALGRVKIVSENPLDEIKKEKSARKRYAQLKENWESLIQDAFARDARMNGGRGPVMNDNTYSATLVTSMLADGAITNLQNMWAPLRAFTRDFGTDQYKPKATVVVKNVTAGPTAQTDPTNFESGDATTGPVSITVSHYTAACHVTQAEVNKGSRMSDLVEVGTASLANKVIDVAVTPITTAIFTAGAPGVISAPAAFGDSDLKTLWGLLKKSSIHNIVLDGEYYANFLPTDRFDFGITEFRNRGWDNFVMNTKWDSAGTNVRGFACNPQAIACAAGLPVSPLQQFAGSLGETRLTVPGIDITAVLYTWLSLASRTMWASYEVMFGAKEADTTAGVVIKSA